MTSFLSLQYFSYVILAIFAIFVTRCCEVTLKILVIFAIYAFSFSNSRILLNLFLIFLRYLLLGVFR